MDDLDDYTVTDADLLEAQQRWAESDAEGAVQELFSRPVYGNGFRGDVALGWEEQVTEAYDQQDHPRGKDAGDAQPQAEKSAMSVYAALDGENGEQIASNKGWSDFGAWVDSLPVETTTNIGQVWEYGFNEELDLVEQQLAAALKQFPPQDVSVRQTAEGLLNYLRDRGDATVLTITNE